MAKFSAAMTEIEGKEMAIIWVDRKHLSNPEELKKYLIFYQDLLKMNDVALMMLDPKDEPIYYGKKEIVEILKQHNWKGHEWKEYSIEKE
ncbi:MAG: hypothetical protein FWG20_02910 [Candidatus Cloacimonetes bacterium]|nr:hypothetical protein [Candidatus Cloacimonadota bacterium]